MDSHLEKGTVPPRRSRRSGLVALTGLAVFALAASAIFRIGGSHLGPLASYADEAKVQNAGAQEERLEDHPLFEAKARAAPTGAKYLIGVGKADITGPVVELNFAGYADLQQSGTGLRQRIYSRAFIIGDVNNPKDRIVYVVQDTQSGDTGIRRGVLEALAALGPDYAVYTQQNVALTGTHSHSGPGAWFNYLLPQVTSLGFSKQSYQAIVDGTVLSIKRAHESLTTVSRDSLHQPTSTIHPIQLHEPRIGMNADVAWPLCVSGVS